MRWLRGLYRGRGVAGSVLRSFPKPEKKSILFAIGEAPRIVVDCFLHTRGQTFIYQAPGRRTPHITDRGVSIATLGWLGTPTEPALIIFSWKTRLFGRLMSVEDSESRRFDLNISVSAFQDDLAPTSPQGCFLFFIRFPKSLNCFISILAHSERC